MRVGWKSLVTLALAFAGAAVVVAVVSTRASEPRLAAAGGDPVSYQAAVVPARIMFGDRAFGELRLTIDTTRVDPAEVKVVPTFKPFRRVGAAESTRVDLGDTTVLTLRYPIQCIDRGCASGSEGRQIDLPVGVLRYVTRQGDILTLPLSFQTVYVASRLAPEVQRQIAETPGELALDPGTNSLPRLGFHPIAGALPWLFAGTSAAIVLALGLALGWKLRRRTAAVAVDAGAAMPPFEAAIQALGEALSGGSEEDRRVALDALARELDAGAPDLARDARRLAWSRSGPDEARAQGLLAAARAADAHRAEAGA
jgi:hypothetical protein